MGELKLCPLECDPFEGDFGDPGDKILSDKMVVAKKEHQCFWCGGIIKLKEQHRSRVDVVDGELIQYRWCSDCCTAMVLDVKSGTFDESEKRINMNRRADSGKGE